MGHLAEIETHVAGVPCRVRLLGWEKYQPARISGPPEDCYPAEGGCGDWELLDMNGQPLPELEERMSEAEREKIDEQFFELMEGGAGEPDYEPEEREAPWL